MRRLGLIVDRIQTSCASMIIVNKLFFAKLGFLVIFIKKYRITKGLLLIYSRKNMKQTQIKLFVLYKTKGLLKKAYEVRNNCDVSCSSMPKVKAQRNRQPLYIDYQISQTKQGIL